MASLVSEPGLIATPCAPAATAQQSEVVSARPEAADCSSLSCREIVARAKCSRNAVLKALRGRVREARLAAAEATHRSPAAPVDDDYQVTPADLLIQEHAARRLIRRLSNQRRQQKSARDSGNSSRLALLRWDETPFFLALGASLAQKLPLYIHFSALRAHAMMEKALRLVVDEAFLARQRHVMRVCFAAVRGEARLHALVQELPRTLDRWHARRVRCRVFQKLIVNCIYRARCNHALRRMAVLLMFRGLARWRRTVANRRIRPQSHGAAALRLAVTRSLESATSRLDFSGAIVSPDLEEDSLNTSNQSYSPSVSSSNSGSSSPSSSSSFSSKSTSSESSEQSENESSSSSTDDEDSIETSKSTSNSDSSTNSSSCSSSGSSSSSSSSSSSNSSSSNSSSSSEPPSSLPSSILIEAQILSGDISDVTDVTTMRQLSASTASNSSVSVAASPLSSSYSPPRITGSAVPAPSIPSAAVSQSADETLDVPAEQSAGSENNSLQLLSQGDRSLQTATLQSSFRQAQGIFSSPSSCLGSPSSTGSSERTLRQLLGLDDVSGDNNENDGDENNIASRDVLVSYAGSTAAVDISGSMYSPHGKPKLNDNMTLSASFINFSPRQEPAPITKLSPFARPSIAFEIPLPEGRFTRATFPFSGTIQAREYATTETTVSAPSEAFTAWQGLVAAALCRRETALRPILARRRFKLLLSCFRGLYENVTHNHLLRRVFGRAVALFCERQERVSTDFRLLRCTLGAWRELVIHRRWRREAMEKDSLACVHRGLRLLRRCFGAWALAASKERRLAIAKQQYSNMLIKAIFVSWLIIAKDQKEMDYGVIARFDRRRLAAIFNSWREAVAASMADKVSRVHQIRIVKYLETWRTLGRELRLRVLADGKAWKHRRLDSYFRAWTSIHSNRVHKRGIIDRLGTRVRLYLLRCAVAAWEGWREERAAHRMRVRIEKKHSSAAYHHQMFIYRWSSSELSDLDAPFRPVVIDEALLDKYVRRRSQPVMRGAVWKTNPSHHGGRGAPRAEMPHRVTSTFVKIKQKTFCVNGSNPVPLVSRDPAATSVAPSSETAHRKQRDLIIDRGVRLGFCNYRPETTVPFKRCIRGVLRAWATHVKRRRRALLAGAFYRSHRDFRLLAASFHAWGGCVPRLLCRSASWLHPDEPASLVTGIDLTAAVQQQQTARLPPKAEEMMRMLPLPPPSPLPLLPPEPPPPPDFGAVITKLVFTTPKFTGNHK